MLGVIGMSVTIAGQNTEVDGIGSTDVRGPVTVAFYLCL